MQEYTIVISNGKSFYRIRNVSEGAVEDHLTKKYNVQLKIASVE